MATPRMQERSRQLSEGLMETLFVVARGSLRPPTPVRMAWICVVMAPVQRVRLGLGPQG